MNIKRPLSVLGAVVFVVVSMSPAAAITFDAAFAPLYSATDLGPVPGLVTPYGGLTFGRSGGAIDPSTLVIGGAANTSSADIRSIGVVRDASKHIIGFSGTSTFIATAPGISGNNGIDGGLQYGPGGVLFYTSYADNSIGQIKPGSAGPDKQIDLQGIGIGAPGTASVGALGFVPIGFPGVGNLKVVLWNGPGTWYNSTVTPDGVGTYNIGNVTAITDMNTGPGGNVGPEGFVYVKAGNPGFAADSILLDEWTIGKVSAYTLDINGDPIVASRHEFITDLTGAEGAVLDPLTGDFLFSTFGATDTSDHVIVVKGFTIVPAVPEPGTLLLLAGGLVALGLRWPAHWTPRSTRRGPARGRCTGAGPRA